VTTAVCVIVLMVAVPWSVYASWGWTSESAPYRRFAEQQAELLGWSDDERVKKTAVGIWSSHFMVFVVLGLLFLGPAEAPHRGALSWLGGASCAVAGLCMVAAGVTRIAGRPRWLLPLWLRRLGKPDAD